MGDMKFDKEAGRAILVNIKNRIKNYRDSGFQGVDNISFCNFPYFKRPYKIMVARFFDLPRNF